MIINPFRYYWPPSLFAAGEQGAWYDPAEFSTLFQDSAGTTPVTAVEQAVGLMLDKSKGLVSAAVTVTNGGFDADSDWTKGTGWSIGSGVATKSAGTAANLTQTIATTTGQWYRVTATLTRTAGGITVSLGTSGTTSGSVTAAGTYTWYILAGSSTQTLTFAADASFAGTVDNVSVNSVSGNHAYQTTSTSRPTLRARVNQYLNTATLATQNATTVAANYTLRFEGTGSVTLSGTATGTYSAGTHTITCTAGTLTSTVSGTVTNADLRVANDGVGLPAYQRVTSATDYDTAGFPVYLDFCESFGGTNTDNSLLTNSIDFATVTSDGQATRNLLTNPTQFDVGGSSWALTNATISANAVAAPDGSTSADKLVANTASAAHLVGASRTLTVATYTFSVYAKAAEYSALRLNYVSSANAAGDFNLANGTSAVSGTNGLSTSIENVGNGWYRCVFTFTGQATTNSANIVLANPYQTLVFAGDNSSGIYIWGAQLETGSTATAFQNIGTDKMTVFAGVRKLSDAATGILAELSAEVGVNAGSFYVTAPETTGASGNFTFRSRRTGGATATSGTMLAPTSRVLTGYGDISGDVSLLRVDGVQTGINTADQGTGNFGNYPLYIGRRNNATLPFSGRLYSLIVRGATTSDAQIAAIETWVNSRARAF